MGAGGFGVVYRARQPSVKREVAIKVILPEFADHPDFIERFETEAQLVARLEHPYIIPLYEYWRDDDGAFLVMRWLKGGSLRDCMEDGPLDLPQVSQLLDQIGGALTFSHDRGVIHRDLKPENILLDEADNAYLTDFGIAKDLSGPGVTESGKIMGSVDYLSPEQAKGEPITPQTDIYALGVVLYELLTCEHPFPDSTPIQMIQKHLNEPLSPVGDSLPHLPEALDSVIQRSTAKNPSERYSSVPEMVKAYQQALFQEEIPTHTPQLPVFLKGGEEEREEHQPIFVGRDREIARLELCLEKALAGKGQVAFVSGGAGRGKTALAAEFCRQAQEGHGDLAVATGDCNAQSGIGDPYLPFRDVFGMLTGDVEAKWVAGGITSEDARRLWLMLPVMLDALLARGSSIVDALIPGDVLLNHAKVALPKGAEQVEQLDDLLRRRKTGVLKLDQSLLFEQCTNVLNLASNQRPLLLFIDDLQWADDASISLLFHLGRRIEGNPILILGAYRPDEVALGRGDDKHPLEGVVNEFKRAYGDIVIDLSLEEELEGRKFVNDLLDSEPNLLSSEFRRHLALHTGGHPLFTIELLRTMQKRGELVQDTNGRWIEGAELSWDLLPVRVEAIIEERIGWLEKDMRRTLSIASVEGNVFTAQVVARVQKVQELQLLQDLSQELGKRHRLVRGQGEVRIGDRPLSRYEFAHHLFQQYLYNDLSLGERRLLHGEMAHVLEELFHENTDDVAVRLAYHYQQADVREKALIYLTQAGQQAKARFANEDAIRLYSDALGLLPDAHPDRFDLLASRAEVYDLLGRHQEQHNDVVWMLEMAEAVDNEVQLCEALIALGNYYLGTEFIHALEPLERAAELALKVSDPVREGRARLGLGYLFFDVRDFARMRAELEMATACFKGADLAGETASSLSLLAVVMRLLNENEEALATENEAILLCREVGDRRQEAISLRRSATVHHNLGNYSEALAQAEEALEINRKLGDRHNECGTLTVLGCLQACLGDHSQARKSLDQSLEMAWDIGFSYQVETALWMMIHYVFPREGDYEQALDLITRQHKKAEVINDDWLIANNQGNIAIVMTIYGQYESALQLLNQALLTYARIGSHNEIEVLCFMGLCQSLLGRHKDARETLNSALARAEKTDDARFRAYSLNFLAHLAMLEGNRERMKEGLKQIKRAMKYALVHELFQKAFGLALQAKLHLALEEIEDALECSTNALDFIERLPAPDAPEDKFFTHAQILTTLGRDAESEEFLRRAYDRVMLVFKNTKDAELGQSWLKNVKVNREILAACVEQGIGDQESVQ